MSLRFVFTKGIAMCNHEILQISKNLHTQSKLQGEIFKLAKFCNKSP